jgi:hypothetical protein
MFYLMQWLCGDAAVGMHVAVCVYMIPNLLLLWHCLLLLSPPGGGTFIVVQPESVQQSSSGMLHTSGYV